MRSLVVFACLLASCFYTVHAYEDDDSAPSMPSYSAPSTTPDPAAEGSSLVFGFGQGAEKHDPVQLTGANFFDLVLDSRGPWMVAFVAPWCGHCQALKEPWGKASRELVSTVRLGLIDATIEKSLAAQFKISSFPTIMAFPAGKKTPKTINMYSGPRGVSELVMFAKGMLNIKLIKLISSTHKQYPENIVTFFGGIARNGFQAAMIPTLLVFLHTPKPSQEVQSLSQSFEHRVQIAVIGKEDEELRKVFRVRSNPAYVACKPGRFTRVNETGTVECTTYDHAAKGAGQSVPALTDFLVKFVAAAERVTPATAPGTDNTDVKKSKIVFRRFTVDKSKANAHVAESENTSVAGSNAHSAAAASNLAPPPSPVLPSSVTEFHTACTDLLQGICLLLLSDQTPQSQRDITGLMRHVTSWNGAHSEKKSVKVLQLQANSPIANTIVEHLNVVIDSSSPINLLALFPHRNRLVAYRGLVPKEFELDDGLDWIERVAGDDPKVKLQKVQNLPKLLKKKVTDTLFGSSKGNGAPPVTTTPAATSHDEL